jgi:hypothetical protein
LISSPSQKKFVYVLLKEKVPKSSDPELFSLSLISVGFSQKLAVIPFHRAPSVSRHRQFLHQFGSINTSRHLNVIHSTHIRRKTAMHSMQ